MATNPRASNRTLRKKTRARFEAQNAPCHICRGRFGPIRYDQPSDPQHPLSLVIDEVIPVSRWREFGYASPAAVTRDLSNLAPAHRCCNAAKGAKTMGELLASGASRGVSAERCGPGAGGASGAIRAESYDSKALPPSLRGVNIADGEW